MADGGKTPVTRGAGKQGYATASTPSAGSAVGITNALDIEGGGGGGGGGGSGEEHGRETTVRPRSRSPTKRTISPQSTAPGRARAIKAPLGAGLDPASSQAFRPSGYPDTSSMTSGTTSPPNSLQAPPRQSQGPFSSSVPATPNVHARRYSNEHRSPSPIPGSVPAEGNISPRSVRSDSDSRIRPSQRALIPAPCKFETGPTTSRRRIPYNLGGDMLEKAPGPVKEKLGKTEEAKLTVEMRALYNDQLLPTPESEDRRAKLKVKLESILNERWPGNDIKVHVFGSSGNLLCTSESDVDICIAAPVNTIGRVCNLAKCLASKGMERVVCIPQAKVPIVKIWDPELKLACDMNVNNTAAIENTRLIRTYVSIDPRVRPLAMVVKHWTKRRILNDAGLGGTLSSYTWISLLIHFLQSRKPPVLPSLQQRPHQRTIQRDGKMSSFADDVEALSTFGKVNEETLGELLFGFFRYYAHDFDYESNVISIRAGKLLTKAEKKWHLSANNRLCVEEPFNTDRNLGNTADDISFRGVHLEIRRAFDLLCEAKLDECCQQYEYPPEQERFWHRPPPQPLPILTRSRSQTNRSSRSSEGGGRNNKGRHSKGSNSARRASSAAASNKNAAMFSPQFNQGQWLGGLVEGGQTPGQILHEQLSQHMTILQQQEAYFKLQQRNMALAQTHAQSVVQLPQGQQPSPRHVQTMRDSPRRSSAIEPGPMSAPLRGLQGTYGFPFPSTIPRSIGPHPTTIQGKQTATNPSSPSLGIGRLAPMDPRRLSQRPMTPENSDMARSRSQPPVSSRDGPLPLSDPGQAGLVYVSGAGGALAGFPGLQQYQQQYLQLKEKHGRPGQHTSIQHQVQNDRRKGNNDPLRLEKQEGEGLERETAAPEYLGYFIDHLSPAQQVVAMQQAQAQTSHSPLIEQRLDRLHPPEAYRIRVQDRERGSRSPSPSLSNVSRDRSYSIQSAQSSGSNLRGSRQAGSLPTSTSSPAISGGPIIIDGSGDSPSETVPSHSSRPNSVYDLTSEAAAAERDRHGEYGVSETPAFPSSDLAHPVSMSDRDTHVLDATMHGSGTYQNYLHFGELPANSAQVQYVSRDQTSRSQRFMSYPEHDGYPRPTSNVIPEGSGSKTGSMGGSHAAGWYDANHTSRPDQARSNGAAAGLGIDVESAISSAEHEGDDYDDDTCNKTPSKGHAKQSQDQNSAPNAFHQQLPQGMANGSAVKSNISNVLKPAPLLSPVREVRTPSPTTSRTNSVLQSSGMSPVEAKQRVGKEKGRPIQHARAVSLLSGEAMHSETDAAMTDGDISRNTSTAFAAVASERSGRHSERDQNQDQGSETQAQVHIPVTPVPLSYSEMARKSSSQTYEEQQKSGQSRPNPQRTTSGSISPRTRSPPAPTHVTNGTTSSTRSAIQNDKVHTNPTEAGGISAGDPSQEPKLYMSQQQMLRAQKTQELKASMARIHMPSVDVQPRTSPVPRAMSHAQVGTSGSSVLQRGQVSMLQSREAGGSQPASSSAGTSTSSGWQQAPKRRGKKNGQNNGVAAMHKRQTNSIGGTVLPSEIGERKGG